jgi:hypothetical protein
MLAAWGYSKRSTKLGRSFIVGEVFFACAGAWYAFRQVGATESDMHFLAFLSLFYIGLVALGEIQVELWVGRDMDEKDKDLILAGYKSFSRCAMIIAGIAAFLFATA